MAGLEGTRLGDYELVERIGGGGMAEVYRAKQLTAFGREVALKVIRPGLSENEAFRARFLREAQSISRLSHPNILPLIEFGQENETLYLVMPLVREGTLRDLLRQRAGALPLEEAILLFTQLCAAVQYAHEQGIIHRDIKPQNVLLQQRSHVLLADFGIARDKEATRMTADGAGLGTVEYMAPEQALGQADKRSDIYSLGVVLYQLLTGVVPYSGSTPLQVLLKRTNEPLPDPRTLNPNLSAQMVQILQTALAQSADERFQTAQALSRAVQQARPDSAQTPVPSAPIWPPRSAAPFPRPSGAQAVPPAPPAYPPASGGVAGPGSAPMPPINPSSGFAPRPSTGGTNTYGTLPAPGAAPFNQPFAGAAPPAVAPARPPAGMVPPPGGSGAQQQYAPVPAQWPAPPPYPTPAGGTPPIQAPRRKGLIAGVSAALVLVLVVGGLLAAGLTGHGPFAGLAGKSTPQASATTGPTATPTAPAGFKLYVNHDHTFKMDYPTGWSATTYNTAGIGEQFEGPASQEMIVSNGGPHQPSDAGKNADSYCAVYSLGTQVNSHKNASFAGQTWIQEECDNPVSRAHSVVSVTVYKGNLYLISFAAPQSSFARDNSQYLSQVEKSFTFLV